MYHLLLILHYYCHKIKKDFKLSDISIYFR